MSLGIGAMLHELSGGSENAPKDFYGKTIEKAWLEDNTFHIDFTDGTKISIWDNGQSCCESRYITCDDNPSDLNGGVLAEIVTKDVDEKVGEYDECHESVFITIQTDKTAVTFCTHNEHNGYYGGFGLTITKR